MKIDGLYALDDLVKNESTRDAGGEAATPNSLRHGLELYSCGAGLLVLAPFARGKSRDTDSRESLQTLSK